jgi:hypothetical protein
MSTANGNQHGNILRQFQLRPNHPAGEGREGRTLDDTFYARCPRCGRGVSYHRANTRFAAEQRCLPANWKIHLSCPDHGAFSTLVRDFRRA